MIKVTTTKTTNWRICYSATGTKKELKDWVESMYKTYPHQGYGTSGGQTFTHINKNTWGTSVYIDSSSD